MTTPTKAKIEILATEFAPRLLICEGRCNPTLPAVDAEVHTHLRRTKHHDLPPALVARQRALRYTPALPVDQDAVWWQCQVCQQVRRYGILEEAAGG